MRWYWKLLIGAGAAGFAALLTRRLHPGWRVAAAGTAFALPFGVDALVKATVAPRAVLLFVSDTHGPATSNAELARQLAAEPGVAAILHGGDIADAPELWRAWWDVPFAALRNVVAVPGNHDVASVDQQREFRRRFGTLPRKVTVGNVDVLCLPWAPTWDDARWLREQVAASTARFRVLLLHHPLWSAADGSFEDRTTTGIRAKLSDALPRIDLVLAGHDHVYWDSTHEVTGGQVRQIIVGSGPKLYACDARAVGCVSGERSYLRIEATDDELRVERKVVL